MEQKVDKVDSQKSTRKRIAQVVTRLDFGGVPDIFRQVAESCREDYAVTIIVGPSKYITPRTKEFLDSFGSNVIWLPTLCRDINPFKDLITFLKLYYFFKKERFDIVHTHTAKAGILGRIAAKLAGVEKVIHMPHGHNFYGYFNRTMSGFVVWAEKFAALFTDILLVLTDLEKMDYVARKVIDKEKIVVVPSGMELEDFTEIKKIDFQEKKLSLGIDESKKVVSMVSRLAPVKGPDVFIEAAIAISKKRSDVLFLLVGDGEMRSELEKKISDNGLYESVRFLGWRNDALEIIALSDVMVQPSLNEAVGRSLLEAQILGVPVVASRVGGIPEVVLEEKTGELFARNDIESLELKLNRLLDDTDYRKKLSTNAVKWAEENFSSEIMTKKILETYK